MLDAMRNRTAAPAAAPATPAAPAAGGNNWNSYEGSSSAPKAVQSTGSSSSRAEAIAMLDTARADAAKGVPAKAAAPVQAAAPVSAGGNNWNSYEGSSSAPKAVQSTGSSSSRAEAIAMLDKARADAAKGVPAKAAAPVQAAAPVSAGGNNWNSYEGSSSAPKAVQSTGSSASRADAIAMLDKARADAAKAPAPKAAAPVQAAGSSNSRAEAIALLDGLRNQRERAASSPAPAQVRAWEHSRHYFPDTLSPTRVHK
jgi:hypothetical protein